MSLVRESASRGGNSFLLKIKFSGVHFKELVGFLQQFRISQPSRGKGALRSFTKQKTFIGTREQG